MLPYLAVSLLDMLAEESVATALHYVFVFIDPIYIIFGGFYYIDKVRVVYDLGYIFGGFYYIDKVRVVYNCGFIFCGFYYIDKVRVVYDCGYIFHQFYYTVKVRTIYERVERCFCGGLTAAEWRLKNVVIMC